MLEYLKSATNHIGFCRILQGMNKVSSTKYQGLYITTLSVLLLLAASEIRIPVGVVPITLQTFVAYLLGLQLDKRSAISTGIAFVAIKMFTLPVLTYPTFGYITGIGLAIPGMCYLREVLGSKFVTCIIGYAITTFFGTLWLRHFLPNWHVVWLHGVAPFLLGDTVKIVGAVYVSKYLAKRR